MPELVFVGTEGVGSRFHVLRSRTRFRRCRGRRGPFSCFARPDSFSAMSRASGHVFIFRAPGLIFDSPECVESRFHILRALTHFRRYRGRRVQFSRFVRPDSFSAVPRASGPVFMSCALGLIFDGTEGVRSLYSYFALLDSFSTVPRSSGPDFLFCATGLIFGGTEGVTSYFHVLRARTHFRRY
jgi:hypothetical protein